MEESASTSLTRVELNNIFRDFTGLYWTGPTGRSRSQAFSRPRQSQFLVVGELDWRQIYSSSQCTGSAFSHWTGVSAGAGSVYTRPASSPADWLQSAGLLAGLV
ncbi:hypothetical protein J6590_024899 [Homalodisca vitripennis]|nr:hypothetical protein J6590_080231 [Homalodisca vitripennis]KAG8312393.1 hypothetical protein J6590_024899 [Homalodisca vitripennis]